MVLELISSITVLRRACWLLLLPVDGQGLFVVVFSL